MIKRVYYGNVEYLGTGTEPSPDAVVSTIAEPKDKGLYVSTFDVSAILTNGYDPTLPPASGVTKKVDLLFYNRTNTLGKVLSTIVYVGEMRDAWDTSDIPYFPELMYRNSLVELTWDLSCNTNYTYVNWERWPAEPESYYVQQDEQPLPIFGMPANIVNRNTPVLDGWYTIVSVGVYVNPPWDITEETWKGYHLGSFAYKFEDGPGSTTWDNPKFSLVQEPHAYHVDEWHDYTIWDNEIYLLGHFVDADYAENNCNLEPPFIRQDFFVMSNYDREYERYLPGYTDKITTLNDPFPSLKCKQRVIDRTVDDNNFKEGQLYLQSTDFIRIKENII